MHNGALRSFSRRLCVHTYIFGLSFNFYRALGWGCYHTNPWECFVYSRWVGVKAHWVHATKPAGLRFVFAATGHRNAPRWEKQLRPREPSQKRRPNILAERPALCSLLVHWIHYGEPSSAFLETVRLCYLLIYPQPGPR
jgi:hypothetical protein